MSMFMQNYTVKTSSIGDPDIYLCLYIAKLDYLNGYYAKTMSSDSYVKEAIGNVKKRMKQEKMEFKKKFYDINYSPNNPLSAVECRPELDISSEFR